MEILSAEQSDTWLMLRKLIAVNGGSDDWLRLHDQLVNHLKENSQGTGICADDIGARSIGDRRTRRI